MLKISSDMDDETDFSMKLSALYLKMALKRAETKEKRRLFCRIAHEHNLTNTKGILPTLLPTPKESYQHQRNLTNTKGILPTLLPTPKESYQRRFDTVFLPSRIADHEPGQDVNRQRLLRPHRFLMAPLSLFDLHRL